VKNPEGTHLAVYTRDGQRVWGDVCAGPAAERLEVFSNASPSPLAVTAEDWPVHPHDASRSGASPVFAGRQPREKWSLTPPALTDRPEGFLNRPMPSGSVTADELAFMVDTQGVLRAVDVATGSQLWQHILGARSIAPPSIDGGRVFVGDTDAVVAVHATYSGSPPRPDSPDARARNQASGWFLSALERGDGKERWRVELPSKPMRGGLAIDRQGNILITFDDGSLRCYQAH